MLINRTVDMLPRFLPYHSDPVSVGHLRQKRSRHLRQTKIKLRSSSACIYSLLFVTYSCVLNFDITFFMWVKDAMLSVIW